MGADPKNCTMHRMLDMYGALPYSQISSDKLSAPYDTMEEAYHAMFTDLTDAINVMTVYGPKIQTTERWLSMIKFMTVILRNG